MTHITRLFQDAWRGEKGRGDEKTGHGIKKQLKTQAFIIKGEPLQEAIIKMLPVMHSCTAKGEDIRGLTPCISSPLHV
ncbi:hypothetical protein D3871_25945 [Noviherbaspirillum saxi]|uniref:Uncharacterized protein n=1 Tax=Noviherbaspirillum saxi TaxID=2320863 RepID=A0A3A3G1Z6_9BURK|nr:hypothetical protein D3871_25945 [Noviherbaspirillum saxi]